MADLMSASDSETESESQSQKCSVRKKKKYHCSFNDEWLKEREFKDWLAKKNDVEAECKICMQTLSVKYEGRRSLIQHVTSEKHTKNVNQMKKNAIVTSFFRQHNTKEDDLITAAEVSLTYHGVKHHHSYLSQDCGNKLMRSIFPDSTIAKKYACGRTKAASIIENVLAPTSQEQLITELKESKYFSMATDSSNRGSVKLFPVKVRNFSKQEGIKHGLLDFYEDSDETSEAITKNLIDVLEKSGLDLNNVSAFSADNASVNYGKNNSVYQKLKARNSGLIAANCKCHILHNCVKYACKALSTDVEILILKVYAEFSGYAKRTAQLESFFEFVELEYQQVLRHVPTRWLSLLPALERILLVWPALRSYFVSKGEEECHKLLWNAFQDEENESIPRLYCCFLQNVMQIFQGGVLTLELDRTTSSELHDIMTGVRKKISDRKQDKFYGHAATELFRRIPEVKRKRFEMDADDFYGKCLTYLDKWYNFHNSEFQTMSILTLSQPVVWTLFQELALKFCIDVDNDKYYEEFCILRDVQKILVENNESVADRWTDFFTKLADTKCVEGGELLKVVSFIFSVPVSNSSCERTFSVMNSLWSKDRNRLGLPLLRAELQVCENFHYKCSEFYDFLMKKPRLLAAAKSDTKYTFKHK